MIKIDLMHGVIWINPFHVTSVESASLSDKIAGSFIQMQNGSGWNTPTQPEVLATQIRIAKRAMESA